LCDPKLCPDAPEDGGRCEECPLNRLEAAENSEAGRLLRRALELRTAARMGIQVGLEDVAADEFHAMVVLDEERERWKAGQSTIIE